MAAKNPNAAASEKRVLQCSADLIRKKNERRRARYEYGVSCENHKEHLGTTYLDTDGPEFRLATEKEYLAYQKARVAERNALRRLETAVRNCPASALAEPAKAPEAAQPKGTLADNLAFAECCARMLELSPSERLALVRKVAASHGVDVAELLGDAQGAA